MNANYTSLTNEPLALAANECDALASKIRDWIEDPHGGPMFWPLGYRDPGTLPLMRAATDLTDAMTLDALAAVLRVGYLEMAESIVDGMLWSDTADRIPQFLPRTLALLQDFKGFKTKAGGTLRDVVRQTGARTPDEMIGKEVSVTLETGNNIEVTQKRTTEEG